MLEVTLTDMADWCCVNSQFESSASSALKRLWQTDQNASFKLLDRKCSTWGKQPDVFTLADSIGPGEFVNNNCCQAKLDKTWIGKKSFTSFFKVS